MRLRVRLGLAVLAAALPLAGATVCLGVRMEQRAVEQVLREFAVTRMENGGRERCEANPSTFPPRRTAHPRRPGPGPGGRDGRPGSGRGGFGPPPHPDGRRPAPEGDLELPGHRPPPPSVGPGGLPVRDAEPGGPRDTRVEQGPPADEQRTLFFAYDTDLTSRNPNAFPIDPELASAIRAGADVATRAYVDEERRREGHEALVRMSWSDGPAAFVLVRRTSPAGSPTGLDPWWAGTLVGGGVLIAVMLALGPVVRRIRELERAVRASSGDTYERPVPVSGNDEIADLARAFNDAATAVRAQVLEVHEREATLRRFVANTTHDVMTPLTVLQGHLSTLRAAVDTTDDDAREAVRDALREVDYTTSLVANLSTVAKLEATTGELERHPVDLNALVERVASRFTPVARAQDVELNVGLPEETVRMSGDVTLLEQAVGNVVQNAVRYNRPGGHVALVLRASIETFSIEVVDDGEGIPAAQLAALQERGARGNLARSRAPGGHGLGLDITRGVCDRHGLDLTFESAEDSGLRVTVSGTLAS